MGREIFVPRNFQAGSMALIDQANAFVDKYQAQGVRLTLRSLYYRFVAADLIPNKQSEYKRLGSILNDARLAGLMDWEAFEDETRFLRPAHSEESPESAIQRAAYWYVEDLWAGQTVYAEQWIEKDAQIGVFEPVCTELQLPWFSCRGSVGQTAMYEAGKRFAKARRQGKRCVMLHAGDYDPSGWDMTRDNEARLLMFTRMGVEVQRIALNMDQIEEYNPPPNPAKDTDSRYARYVEETGCTESWEMDALEPMVMRQFVRDAVAELVDGEAWDAAKAASDANKEIIEDIAARFDEIAAFLADEP